MKQIRIGFLLVVALAGCQSKLNFSKNVELAFGDDFRFTVDPPKRDQRVIVEFNSSAAPINLSICLKSDENAVAASLVMGKMHEGVLAKIEKTQQGTMEANIPAGKESVVFLWGATKNTTVKIHIKGK